MSANYFIQLRGKYSNFSGNSSTEQINLPIVSTNVQPIPNPRPISILESQRVAKKICPTVANGRNIAPVLIQPVPASATTARLAYLTSQAALDPTNPEARFSNLLPPIVPPPWYLQTPRTRATNEPYARIYPCVTGRGKVMQLY
jgi:hypothetical protein